MNTTPFMDKQIMDLTHSGSSQSKDLIDLINNNNHNHKHNNTDDEDERVESQLEHHRQETLNNNLNGIGVTKDDIIPSYDFQPIRPLAASSPNYDSAPNLAASAAFSTRSWNSDSNANTSPPRPLIKSYSSLDTIEPTKVAAVGKDQKALDAIILSEIDQTMKKHMENLLHVMEGVSARLTQLESRTHRLENSVDDFKVSVGNNHGSTDGKLRQLENILREVQSGVQTVKDKQDILEAQLQLAKLQVSKTDQQSETQTSVVTNPIQQGASAPQQSQPQFPPHANLPQSIPAVPSPNAPPQPPPQQGLPPPIQLANQFPQNQIPAVPQRDSYFTPPPPVQPQEAPNQQYQVPPTQQPHPQPGAPPHQQYQQSPHPQFSQPAPHIPQQQPAPHLPQQPPAITPVNLPQIQSSLGQHVEETPYVPSQNYPPTLHQPTSQPPSGPPPTQQYYGAPTHAYEPPSSRPNPGYSSGYGTLSAPAEPYRYGGSSQYGGTPALKPQQLPTASSVSPSSGSGYPQLPTARVLPQALPTASVASGGSGSTGGGNRVPIDDVVDKVSSMGFPRDHVRATVRKLTENGQSVDLNAVLDKLMNDGELQQRGWFNR
ncbi:hypothetical protein HN51_008421 [Arachis hypogaea]|uniref:DUF1421 domain-containing protein n=2 Tax=Arachis TaxID=3817 RepID=A0A445D3F1_ARAHY|nr:uncharacterized protein LOC107490056 [Arachis duranensis]XP_025700689.1 bromodomain-containing protein 4 [Arachis hypogaea]QHO42741.1 uncharacterized protein DS421_5g156830 [Arachis hypogaea]RYR57763.1 hypothetical protein Ahy_A05g023469 [Arachis hypogaea]